MLDLLHGLHDPRSESQKWDSNAEILRRGEKGDPEHFWKPLHSVLGERKGSLDRTDNHTDSPYKSLSRVPGT